MYTWTWWVIRMTWGLGISYILGIPTDRLLTRLCGPAMSTGSWMGYFFVGFLLYGLPPLGYLLGLVKTPYAWQRKTGTMAMLAVARALYMLTGSCV